MVTVSLGIPTINRKDIFQDYMSKYQDIWFRRHMLVIDNGNQNIETKPACLKHSVRIMHHNIGVAASWNAMMAYSNQKGYTHCAIYNDDIYYSRTPVEIEEFIQNNPADIYLGTKSWSVFVLPYSVFYQIGPFDEDFKGAYFEDNDYERRMTVAGLSILRDEFFDPEIYENSMSIRKDRSLNVNFDNNRERYVRKWGGMPGSEKFQSPFNIEMTR